MMRVTITVVSDDVVKFESSDQLALDAVAEWLEADDIPFADFAGALVLDREVADWSNCVELSYGSLALDSIVLAFVREALDEQSKFSITINR